MTYFYRAIAVFEYNFCDFSKVDTMIHAMGRNLFTMNNDKKIPLKPLTYSLELGGYAKYETIWNQTSKL
jgi:hypothetical protein